MAGNQGLQSQVAGVSVTTQDKTKLHKTQANNNPALQTSVVLPPAVKAVTNTKIPEELKIIKEQEARAKQLDVLITGTKKNLESVLENYKGWKAKVGNIFSWGQYTETLDNEQRLETQKLENFQKQKIQLDGFLKQAKKLQKEEKTDELIKLCKNFSDKKINFHTELTQHYQNKVTQNYEALDNSLDNSEYWLKLAKEADQIALVTVATMTPLGLYGGVAVATGVNMAGEGIEQTGHYALSNKDFKAAAVDSGKGALQDAVVAATWIAFPGIFALGKKAFSAAGKAIGLGKGASKAIVVAEKGTEEVTKKLTLGQKVGAFFKRNSLKTAGGSTMFAADMYTGIAIENFADNPSGGLGGAIEQTNTGVGYIVSAAAELPAEITEAKIQKDREDKHNRGLHLEIDCEAKTISETKLGNIKLIHNTHYNEIAQVIITQDGKDIIVNAHKAFKDGIDFYIIDTNQKIGVSFPQGLLKEEITFIKDTKNQPVSYTDCEINLSALSEEIIPWVDAGM
jgi:hypothetical protein